MYSSTLGSLSRECTFEKNCYAKKDDGLGQVQSINKQILKLKLFYMRFLFVRCLECSLQDNFTRTDTSYYV